MSFIRRYLRFFREVRAELRKVTWPSANDTVVYTGVVLFSVAVVALIIWAGDTIFGGTLHFIISG